MHQDLRRLSPAEQVRFHMRRNEPAEALKLLRDRGDLVEARRLAWRLIQDGAAWRTSYRPHPHIFVNSPEERLFRPLVNCTGWDMLDAITAPETFVEVAGVPIQVRWSQRSARLFAVDCARSVLDRLQPQEVGHVRSCIRAAMSGDRREMVRVSMSPGIWMRSARGLGAGSCSIAANCCNVDAFDAAKECARDAAQLAGGGYEAWEVHALDVLTPLALRRLLLPEEDAR